MNNTYQQDIHQQSPQNQKRIRQRTLRACDTCRKMKIKCLLDSGEPPCEACKISARPCTFQHVGVKREKPPTVREIEQLNRKITQLEAVLLHLRPQIDLSSLPRTHDQAKTMANALQAPLQDPSQHTSLPIHPIRSQSPIYSFINDHQDLVDLEHSESEEDSQVEEEDQDDINFLSLLKALDRFEIGTSHLLDHERSSTQLNSQFHSLQSSEKSNHNLPINHDIIQDQSLSSTEKYLIQRFDLDIYPTQNWPDPDLETSLISIYFNTIHFHPLIIHQSEFHARHQSGLANRDHQFAQLCFAIFAAASPYSDDPRVIYSPQQNPLHPRQSSGALFATSALFHLFQPAPLSLLQLQTMAVMSFYFLRMSNPRNTSALVHSFMRKAVSSGVHLENSPRWNGSFIGDQLRKGAFFTLVAVDKLTSQTLDYLRVPRAIPDLVEDSLYIDDAELDLLDAQGTLKPTHATRKQFKEQLASSAQTPGKAVVESMSAMRSKFEGIFHDMILDQLNNPGSSASTPATISSSDDHPLPKTKIDSKQFILRYGSLLSQMIETELPPQARWNPSLTNKKDLRHTAQSICLLRSMQIRVYLQVITEFPELSQTCFQAASTIVDVLEDLRVLDHLNLIDANIPYLLCPAGLMFLWIISQNLNSFVTTDTKANAWLKIQKCIEILNLLAPTSFVSAKLSQKFTDCMEHLKEEIHCPTNMNHNYSTAKKSSKRPFSEIMAKKFKQPTVSNFLYSQYSSPDDNSNDSIGEHRPEEKFKSSDISNISDVINMVDSFQSPSPDLKSSTLIKTTIPIQKPVQVNQLNTLTETQAQPQYQDLQLQDLFPFQFEMPQNLVSNWNYGNGILPSSGNQALATNEFLSNSMNPSINPVDGFINYPSSSPSTAFELLKSNPSSLMPADLSCHLVVEGSTNDQNTCDGLVYHRTKLMPMNSINTSPTHNMPVHVNKDNTVVRNLADSGLNSTTVSFNTLPTNVNSRGYQRLSESSSSQGSVPTTVNTMDSSQLIIPTTPRGHLLHLQQQQGQHAPHYTGLFTPQFNSKQSASNLKLVSPSSDFRPSSFPDDVLKQHQHLMQCNPSSNEPSTGFGSGCVSSTTPSVFNRLDGSLNGLPHCSFMTTNTNTNTTTILPQNSSHFEGLDCNYQNSIINSGVELMDRKGPFKNQRQNDLTNSNQANRNQIKSHDRSQSFVKPPSSNFSIPTSSHNHLANGPHQTNLIPPTGSLNPEFDHHHTPGDCFNFDDQNPQHNLMENDLNGIFSSIRNSWLF